MTKKVHISVSMSAERPWILVFTWTAIGTNNFVKIQDPAYLQQKKYTKENTLSDRVYDT